MQYTVILAAVLALPSLLGIFFRVSASNLFFSVMAGELLARYFGHEAESALKTFTNNESFANYGEVLILTLPVVLTAIVMRGSVTRNKTLLQVIPYAITGLVYAVFLLPLLPEQIQSGIKSAPYGNELFELNSAIIGVIVLLQLIALWLMSPGEGHKKHGKKKH